MEENKESECPLFKKKSKPVPKGENIPLVKKPSPLKEIWDWYRNSRVKPYVKVKGLNGECVSGIGHTAVEAGIKITF